MFSLAQILQRQQMVSGQSLKLSESFSAQFSKTLLLARETSASQKELHNESQERMWGQDGQKKSAGFLSITVENNVRVPTEKVRKTRGLYSLK